MRATSHNKSGLKGSIGVALEAGTKHEIGQAFWVRGFPELWLGWWIFRLFEL